MPNKLSVNTTGEVEMFYTGATPWHGLGTRLDNPATAAEAIKSAHLDWEVESFPIYTGSELVPKRVIPGYQAITRNDTGAVLSVMSSRYEMLQNMETWGFMDTVVGMGLANYHTAGALRDGRVLWILADANVTQEVVANDPVQMYLLLTTSHDGSLALQITTTPVRVVCWNTMRAALRSHSQAQITIRHTSTIRQRMAAAEQALVAGRGYFDAMVDEAKTFANRPMSENYMNAFAHALFNADPNGPRKISTLTEGAIETLSNLFITGRGQENSKVRGTAWAAYNAVTEYVDYASRVQKIGSEPQGGLFAQDRRLHRSWFGDGQKIRNRAWNLLRDYRVTGPAAFAIKRKPIMEVA